MTKQEQELIILGHIIIKHYYSFKIFSCFWLVKTTRIIYHNQLLLTKFGKNLVILNQWCQKCSPLQFIEPMKSKWIMYLIGGRDRCIGQYIGRYIGRYSMEYCSILDRINRYIGRVSTDVLTDTPIGRYILGGSLRLHWYLTDTSPILHQCFTDTLPSPNVLVDIDRYIGWYIGRHSTRR